MPFGGLLTVGLIGAGTNILGGIIGSNASQKAAGIQSAAGKQAAGIAEGATQDAQNAITGGVGNANNSLDSAYSEELARLAPYLQAGGQGINELATGLAPGGQFTKGFGDFSAPTGANEMNDPGYQFRLQQGQKALENSAAARGNATGGAAMKAAERYGQDYASNEYSNVYNRALNTYGANFNTFETNQGNLFNRIFGLAGIGQNSTNAADAASQLRGSGKSANIMGGAGAFGNFGLEGAQIVGNDLTGAANARAAGTVGSANAWGSALGGLGSDATNMLLLSRLNSSGYGSGSGPGAPGNAGYQPIGTMNPIP